VAHQQTTAASAMPSGRRGQEQTPRKRLRAPDVIRKLSQILGELLITGGVVLLLFVGWQLWWTNVEADAKQTEAIQNFAQQLTGPVTPAESANPADYGDPVVGTAPDNGETIGIMYIPRFGADYTRPIIEGTGADVLDTLGLGHYGSTSMPGAVGNFAVAGHRQTHGAVLDSIHTLVPGDKIYVQTKDGYYVYVFRNNQIVMPSRTDVLEPVPTLPGVTPTESFLTMTSCNPRFGAEERIIAYALLDSWRPASAGPPVEIAAQVAAAIGKG
jgi:sortase A